MRIHPHGISMEARGNDNSHTMSIGSPMLVQMHSRGIMSMEAQGYCDSYLTSRVMEIDPGKLASREIPVFKVERGRQVHLYAVSMRSKISCMISSCVTGSSVTKSCTIMSYVIRS